MAIEAGSVFARLGAILDETGFDRFDKAVAAAQRTKPVDVGLSARHDRSGFDQFDRAVSRARSDAAKGATARLDANDDGARGTVSRFLDRVGLARRETSSPIVAHLDARADTHALDTYNRALRDTERDVVRGSGRIRTAVGTMFIGGAGAAAAATALYGTARAAKSLIGAYEESRKVAAQTDAVLKSTGGTAGVTAKQIGDLATAISRKSAVDDEAVQSAENVLLTFTNVRNEAGQGNDIFNQSTRAIVDLSAALGQDLQSSTVQVGKALNDPIKGVTALSRVGVSFTAQQKEQIKTLVESGRTLDAQKLILGELTKEFGGSADAAATNSGRLKVAVGNVAESIGEKLNPYVQKASGYLLDFIDGMQSGEGAGGRFADTLKKLRDGVGKLTDAVGSAVDGVVGFFSDLVKDNQENVVALKRAWDGLVGPIRNALRTIRREVSQAFGKGGVLKDIRDIVDALADIATAFYTHVVAPINRRVIPGVSQALAGVVRVVRGVVKVIAGILTLDFGKAWDGVKLIFSGGLKFIGGVLRAGTAPIRAAFSAIWRGFAGIAKAAWDGVTSVVRKGLDFILGGVTSVQGAIEAVVRVGSHLPLIGGQFRALADDIKKGRAEIDRYRESLRETDSEHSRSSKGTSALRDRVSELRLRLDRLRSGTDAYRQTASQLRDAQGRLNDKVSASKGTSDRARSAVKLLRDGALMARDAFDTAAATIAAGYNSLASQFGVEKVVYKAVSNVAGSVKAPKPFAVGGIPNPGAGGADDHVLLDPNGRPVALMSGTEGVLNRPQMGIVDTALRVAASVGALPFNGLAALWGAGMRHYAGGGILDRAGALDSKHLPYKWGGGHALARPYTLADLVAAGGADCSGAVSYVLGIAPRVSGALTTIGKPGPGAVTIYANPTHTFMSIFGRGFGTSAENPGGGPGWLSYNSRPGFVVRNVSGDFGGAGDLVAPRIAGPGTMRGLLQAGVDKLTSAGRKKLASAVGSIGGGQPLNEGSYSKSMLRGLWSRVGGNSGSSNLAAAVALAESGGDPNSRNVNTNGTIDRGLWQINSIHGALSTFDPRGNAQAAVRLSSNGRSWRPWVAYNNGSYRKFLNTGGVLRRLATGGMVGSGSSKWWPSPAFSGTKFRRHTAILPDNNATYAAMTQELADLDRLYQQAERRYNQTDEILIDEQTGRVDKDAVAKRVAELNDLIARAFQIWNKLKAKVAFAVRIAKSYAQTVSQLTRSLRYAKAKDRSGIKAEINAYRGAQQAWSREATDVGFEASDAELDYFDVIKERNEVAATKGETAESSRPAAELNLNDLRGDGAGDTGGSVDTGGSSGGGSSGPSAEDIAAAARAQLAAFNQNRADLFGGYGQNFVTAGTRAIYDPTTGAAGFRHFGAVPGGAFEVAGPGGAAGGRGGVSVVNNYAAPPPDPHTWSRGIEFELQSIGR